MSIRFFSHVMHLEEPDTDDFDYCYLPVFLAIISAELLYGNFCLNVYYLYLIFGFPLKSTYRILSKGRSNTATVNPRAVFKNSFLRAYSTHLLYKCLFCVFEIRALENICLSQHTQSYT